MSPISSKTTVAQSVLTPISSNRKNAHGVFLKLYLPSKTTVAQSVLTPIFKQKQSCARSFLQYGLIGSETTVPQSDLRPISSNSTVVHAAFYNFYLKQEIKVSWILLSIHTNLGRFSVVRPLSHKL